MMTTPSVVTRKIIVHAKIVYIPGLYSEHLPAACLLPPTLVHSMLSGCCWLISHIQQSKAILSLGAIILVRWERAASIEYVIYGWSISCSKGVNDNVVVVFGL